MRVRPCMLPDDCSVKDALDRISADESAAECDVVCIVDREGHLQGSVALASLLRAAQETPITALLPEGTAAISGQTSLASASEHDGWALGDTLPVVNREHQLVGLIRHADLRKGVEQTASHIARPDGDDPVRAIFEIYGGSLAALFGAAGELMGVERPMGEYR